MNGKTVAFHGKAGGFFVATIVSTVMAYVLVIGWPISLNFFVKWLADNTEINGRKVVYQAGYGETLKLLVVGILLVMVTLGIYMFWFYPKVYRFIADHISYVDDTPAPDTAPAGPAPAAPPAAPAV